MIWRTQVYFARDPATGLVKIGHSYSVARRLAALARRHPGIELLATIAGDRYIEDRFHTLLIETHVGHEWFAPSARLDAVIIGVREGWLDTARLPDVGSAIRSASAVRGHQTRRARIAIEALQAAQRPDCAA